MKKVMIFSLLMISSIYAMDDQQTEQEYQKCLKDAEEVFAIEHKWAKFDNYQNNKANVSYTNASNKCLVNYFLKKLRSLQVNQTNSGITDEQIQQRFVAQKRLLAAKKAHEKAASELKLAVQEAKSFLDLEPND
ncbi:MAG: hypothetical protein P4L22_04340 [Candidatus Babeliales bacterium]|nr:hypothetical protein [Candidatus Babeliales bacterium]